MLIKTRKIALLLSLFICASQGVSKQADLHSTVAEFLQQQVANTGAPSLSVAVGVGGKVILSDAVGLADKSQQRKADIDTQYRTGSVSKVIGTLGFMPLLEKREVRLDDKIRHYLPYLPKHYNEIALSHILTHTSGIRHYRFGEYGTNIHYPTLQAATKVFRDDPLQFAPGTGYQYSTYGINLIQGVIEQVSGESLASYLNRVLFIPLNMSHTQLEISGQGSEHYATGYRSILSGFAVKDIDVSNKYIGGGMRTTPTDLVKMVQSVNQGAVINNETKAKMLSVPFPNVAGDRALGWRWMEHQGEKAFGHGGAINGFESFLVHFVEDDITIAVMVNQDDYDHTSDTLYKILDIVRKSINLKTG